MFTKVLVLGTLALTLAACGFGDPAAPISAASEPVKVAVPTALAPVAQASDPDYSLERIKHEWMVETHALSKATNIPADYLELYIPVYLATACIEQLEPTVAAFTEYIKALSGDSIAPEALAIEVISQLKAMSAEAAPIEDRPCLRPFIAPVSTLELSSSVS